MGVPTPDVPAEGGIVRYVDQVRALIGSFDRERSIDLLARRTGWTRRRFARFSDKKLVGWLLGEVLFLDTFGGDYRDRVEKDFNG